MNRNDTHAAYAIVTLGRPSAASDTRKRSFYRSAESAIRDADVAEEISAFTRSQILTQAATAMVAQANALPQNALTLLQ